MTSEQALADDIIGSFFSSKFGNNRTACIWVFVSIVYLSDSLTDIIQVHSLHEICVYHFSMYTPKIVLTTVIHVVFRTAYLLLIQRA